MKTIRLNDRIRYQFDNMMSKGIGALLVWLFLATFGLLVLIAILAKLTPEGQPVGFSTLVWMGLMRTLDSGTMGGDQGGWPFLFLMLLATIGGIFVVGTIISILTSGMDQKMTELRKGRSLVVERDHTIILGWSPEIFYILSELTIANASRKKTCVAILAEKDKVEMDDEINEHIPDKKTTRFICRTGNPIDPKDLEIVNVDQARSIIILPSSSDDPDTEIIKTMLAITNHPNRRTTPYHIVATIHDPENEEIARLIGKDEVQLILADDLIARITAQTCRQSGLSVVYTELLDFEGDEIYFQAEPSLAGTTFADAMFRFETSLLIGLKRTDGTIQLKPPMDTLLQPKDQLILIAEDDNKIQLSHPVDHSIATHLLQPGSAKKASPESTLVLGWNERASRIIRELDYYVAPNSHLDVVAEDDLHEMQQPFREKSLTNQKITFQHGDTTKRSVLDKLKIQQYQHVILLSNTNLDDVQRADAKTLITLLHLRDLSEKSGCHFSIVSEMLDNHNRELAEVTRADDFIVSEKLVSLMLTQISENKELAPVFSDIFDPQGSEIYLKPVGDYLKPGEPVDFYTLLEAGRRRAEIVIGYRIETESDDPHKAYGVHINPVKSESVLFSPEDKLILLAEE